MLIKYEVNIKDCSQCNLLLRLCDHTNIRCNQDFQDGEVKVNDHGKMIEIIKLPCQLRPCPIEVK